jgi:hypothetical protein
MRSGRRGWWTVLRWSIVVSIIALEGGQARVAVAQTPCCYGDNAGTRPGIEAAVSRYYTTDGNPNHLSAYVFRFDGEANALASLEAIDAQHAGGILPDDAAISIDELGPNTHAYSWEYEPSGLDAADILTADGVYLYIVSVVPWDQEIDAVALATTTIQEMIAAPAGDDPGTLQSDGSSAGGLWDKLPPGDGESPAGFSVGWDEQVYPEPETTDEETDPDAFDFAALDGIERAVTRSYSGDTSVLASPETAPATTYFLNAFVGEFDSADHAAAALEPLYTNLQASFADDLSITMEGVDPGNLGDQAIADFGTAEEDGVTYELALIFVQVDPYVYGVIAVGIGTDTGSMETATDVVEAMTEAEAGSGDGEYDESGIFLTGGLWDKLPADGDAVLHGLVPEEDEQVYP